MFNAKVIHDLTDQVRKSIKSKNEDLVLEIIDQVINGSNRLMLYDDVSPSKKVLNNLKKLGFKVDIVINKTQCEACQACYDSTKNDPKCLNMEVEQLTYIRW